MTGRRAPGLSPPCPRDDAAAPLGAVNLLELEHRDLRPWQRALIVLRVGKPAVEIDGSARKSFLP
jgi:hypothetical protein